jgi:iron(III) transport system ATP-binding protein
VRRLAPGKIRVRLGEADVEIADTEAADGEATVAVRPEAITVAPAPGPAGTLSGKIVKASYLGTHMEYSIDTAAGTLFATCPRVERPLVAGMAVAVTLAPRGVIIVRQ